MYVRVILRNIINLFFLKMCLFEKGSEEFSGVIKR